MVRNRSLLNLSNFSGLDTETGPGRYALYQPLGLNITQFALQIPTKDFRSPPCPITRSKLAKNIARTVERFIKVLFPYGLSIVSRLSTFTLQEKSRAAMDPDEDPRWRVGPGHITIDDLVLVGLQHVSKGSWQCHLRLNRSL
jgi:hypothetical protein